MENIHDSFTLVDWLVVQHVTGLGHRDAKGGNIRLSLGDGRCHFWWVDLEDLRGPERLSETARRHQLVQLNASLADEAFDDATRRYALERYLRSLPFAEPVEGVARDLRARSIARGHRYRGEKANSGASR